MNEVHSRQASLLDASNLHEDDNQQSMERIDAPLAYRIRPNALQDVAGQDELTKADSWFAKMIAEKRCCSCIFWGPPGVGKTTLANVMADAAHMPFTQLSAVSAGKAEVQAVVRQAKQAGQTWLLFLDEIHRFNKAQQDVLLPYIEDGTLILVGATTENPSFSLNNALLSRCRIVVLESLDIDAISAILKRARDQLQQQAVAFDVQDDAIAWLATHADGDARYALNGLEALFDAGSAQEWSKAAVEKQGVRRSAKYDRDGDAHYDLISALHKCVRDSDVDAALYWLARMLEAGETPLYIARRLIRIATEDIGLADPKALHITLDAHRMFEILGSPEGEQGLFEAVIYLALAPKSNAAYVAEKAARKLAKQTQQTDVPMHLKNAPTKLMQQLGHGAGYQYAHNDADAVVDQQHFPNGVDETLYQPIERGFERILHERMLWLEKQRLNKGHRS